MDDFKVSEICPNRNCRAEIPAYIGAPIRCGSCRKIVTWYCQNCKIYNYIGSKCVHCNGDPERIY